MKQVTHCLRLLTNVNSVRQTETRIDGVRKVVLWSELVLFGGTGDFFFVINVVDYKKNNVSLLLFLLQVIS